MPDDNEPSNDTDPSDITDPPDDVDEERTDADETDPAASTPDDGASPDVRTFDMRGVNRQTAGRLSLHYPAREIELIVDGDAALRLLSMWNRSTHDLADDPDPARAYAGFGWAGIDLSSVLVATWTPGLGDSTERVVVDPVVTH